MERLRQCLQLSAIEIWKISLEEMSKNEFGTAFALQMFAFKKDSSLLGLENNLETCLTTVCNWITKLYSLKMLSDIQQVCLTAIEVTNIPKERFFSILIEQLCSLNCYSLANLLLRDNRDVSKKDLVLIEASERISSYLIERWHYVMLNDKARNQAYSDALKNAADQDDECDLIDIGCGTGIFSLLAVNHGFHYVSACEASIEMYHIARNVLEENKSTKSEIKLFPEMSTSLEIGKHLPKRAKVAVMEIFDSALLGEGVISTMKHALLNLLVTESPKVIPKSAIVFGTIIESFDIRQHSRVINDSICAINLSKLCFKGAKEFTEHNHQPYTTERLSELRYGYKALSESFQLFEVQFASIESLTALENLSSKLSVTLTENGKPDAVAVWFQLDLGDDITVTNAPGTGSCWEQAVFPVTNHNASASKGDAMEIKYFVDARECLVVECNPCFAQHNGYSTSIINEPDSLVNVSRQMICRLNDTNYFEMHKKAIQSLSNCVEEASLNLLCVNADCSLLPLVLSSKNTTVHAIERSDDQRRIYKYLSGTNNCNAPRLCSLYDLYDQRYDVIVVEVLETFNLFNNQLLNEFQVLRDLYQDKRCNGIRNTFTVCPSTITTMGMLISSPTLVKRNRIINDDVTLGLNIKNHINEYEVSCHPNVDLESLPHVKLSEPFEVFNFDMASHDFSKEIKSLVSIPVSYQGDVSAIVMWHHVVLAYDQSFTTQCNKQTHWRQTAFVLPQVQSVQRGDIIGLECRNINGIMRFTIAS